MALVGPLSASDGSSVIQVSGSIEVLTGNTISVEGGGDPGLYAAGDGLDLVGITFSTDLKLGGGLKIDSTELAVEVSDFAGGGLEDDGSDNLRISAAAAGAGLTGGGGSALSIDNSVVATISGSTFAGAVKFTSGLSGSLTKLDDGSSYLIAGSSVTVTTGASGAVTIASSDTTYTAGDGLDLSGTEFSTDLKSGGGLKIDSTELAVEVNDFAGTGLEDDSSDNLRISAAAAGDGLTGGGGSALTVGGGTGISIAADDVGVDYAGADSFILAATDGTGITVDGNNDKLVLYDNDAAVVKFVNAGQVGTTYTAGDGLDLSGTTFSTDLKSGGGLKIDTTELAVEPGDFAGAGLEDDGSDNLRISAAAAGLGLVGGGGTALDIDNTIVATLTGSQFSGNVGVTGSVTVTGLITSNNGTSEFSRIDVGGGYGSTGITLWANGGVSLDGALRAGGDVIEDSGGNSQITFTAGNKTTFGYDATVTGDLTVSGNDIKGSAGTAITFSGVETQLAGDLKVGGNDIKDSGGNTQITFAAGNKTTFGYDLDVSGDVTVGGNNIKGNGGSSGITFDGSGNTAVDGDLKVTGNTIQDSAGIARVTFDEGIGAVIIAGDLHVSGTLGICITPADTAGDNEWVQLANVRFPNNTQATATAAIMVQMAGRANSTWSSLGWPKAAMIYVANESDGGNEGPIFTVDLLGQQGIAPLDPNWTLDNFILTYDTSGKRAAIWVKAPGSSATAGRLYGTILNGSQKGGGIYIGDWTLTSDQSWGASFTSLGTDKMASYRSMIVDKLIVSGSITENLMIGGTIPPDFRLHVEDSQTGTAGYTALFDNIANSNTADGIRINVGYTLNPGASNAFIQMRNSSSAIGKVIGDGSGGVSYLDAFTGRHPTVTASPLASLVLGLIVSSTGEIWKRNEDTVSTGLPKVALATTDDDKSVFGILSVVETTEDPEELMYGGYHAPENIGEGETAVVINSIGEGLVWITNLNGNISKGDYITTSTISGHGQKQDDDILHNYTVGKCVETVEWDSVTDTVEHNGTAYKKYLAACTYNCG